MRLIVAKEPQITEVDGKRGRTWTGKNSETDNVVRVTIAEGPTPETSIIIVDELADVAVENNG